jgi:hypothetical protein
MTINDDRIKSEDLRPRRVMEEQENWIPWKTEDGWQSLDEIFPPICQ